MCFCHHGYFVLDVKKKTSIMWPDHNKYTEKYISNVNQSTESFMTIFNNYECNTLK